MLKFQGSIAEDFINHCSIMTLKRRTHKRERGSEHAGDARTRTEAKIDAKFLDFPRKTGTNAKKSLEFSRWPSHARLPWCVFNNDNICI